MKVIIVNEQDQEIGLKDRHALVHADIYRATGLWITNTAGDVLLSRRAYIKSHDPGKWGPAVAGTVELGETYDSNIIKEAEEELGLKGIKPEKWMKEKRRTNYNYWSQWYRLVLDIPVEKLQPDPTEVAEVRWFTLPELKQALLASPDDFLGGVHRRVFEL